MDHPLNPAGHGITCSISRRRDCYDKAVMERFLATFESELGEWCDTCGEDEIESFDYPEAFHT